MIQPAQEIEDHYKNPDPWGYQTNPDDIYRKKEIVSTCKFLIPYSEFNFKSVLDIGAGEGWITKDLPAVTKSAYELSDQAAARFPEGVTRCLYPFGEYELVTACGILYQHYDIQKFFEFFKMASRYVVTCNIEDWEVPQMRDVKFLTEELGLIPQMERRFKYREYFQKLRVFKVKHV